MMRVKTKLRLASIALAGVLLTACAGKPVQLGNRVTGPVPLGESRLITGEACGFQLFLFIPIAINSRLESAYTQLEAKAAGDYITDVEVQESWTYGYLGTLYCTELRARAIRTR